MQSALATRTPDKLWCIHVCVCVSKSINELSELSFDLSGNVTSINIELKTEHKFQDLTLYSCG